MTSTFDEFRLNYMQYIKLQHDIYDSQMIMSTQYDHDHFAFEIARGDYEQSMNQSEELYEKLMNQSSEMISQIDNNPDLKSVFFQNLLFFVNEEILKRQSGGHDLDFDKVKFLYLLKFKLESKSKNSTKENDYTKKSLPNIWKKGSEHYKEVINFLSEVSPTLGTPFISILDNNNKPTWIPNHKYLGAFVKACLVAGFIPKLTAKEYFDVIHNTFEVTIKTEDVFKPLADITTQHMDPFKRWVPEE